MNILYAQAILTTKLHTGLSRESDDLILFKRDKAKRIIIDYDNTIEEEIDWRLDDQITLGVSEHVT